jgi:septal ring factor EnvC (AmiA/AmiB activator)
VTTFSPPRAKRSDPRTIMVMLAACAFMPVGAQAQRSLNATAEDGVRQADAAAETAARQNELKAIEEDLRANKDLRAKLEQEIAAIKDDRAKLNGALLDTTEKARAGEERLAAIEARLQTLDDSAAAIRKSFDNRRAVIAEVLASLQRMGRRPPPAVLVRPEDMLAAVRTSILLGAVVPELRGEAETLAVDLAELVRLSEQIKIDRDSRRQDLATLVVQRERLASLIAARQARLVEAEKSAGDEAARAAALAAQAQTLKDLIVGVTGAAGPARGAAAIPPENQSNDQRERLAALAFKDPARLAPKIAFADTRGLLPLPVAGRFMRSFGAPDGFGGKTQGISLSARAGAAVSSPCDGWVAFAGPFRSFGQLLIINAGGGYYVLLAGMEKINVSLGQFVLAGEPVAVMGDAAAPSSAAIGGGTSGPVLYIEFRKDGGSIDPSPWWVKTENEKARG